MSYMLLMCGVLLCVISIVIIIYIRVFLRQVDEKKCVKCARVGTTPSFPLRKCREVLHTAAGNCNSATVSNKLNSKQKYGVESEQSSIATSENDSESDSDSSSSSTPERTAKMQFLVLNKGSNKHPNKLAPNVIADDVAGLAVSNIILISRTLGEGDHLTETKKLWRDAYITWCSNGVTKITLRVDKRLDFDDIVRRVQTGGNDGLPMFPISVKDYSDNRCLAAIGPYFSEEMAELTGHLKLLS